jgi:hypothetical protein
MGSDVEPSRSFPFFETMFIVDDIDGDRRLVRSLERRENIKLRCADIFAYVDSAVNAIWAFLVDCTLY